MFRKVLFTFSTGFLGSLLSFLIVVINNGFGVVLGRGTSATADGRGRGQPLSNGNAPTLGNDRSGLTAVLNSMAKLRADHHAGAVHNLSVTCRMLKRDRQRFLALLDGYWDQGGTQLMLNPVDPGQLQDAMLHPKNYPNLLVRMGGWSARFVDLSARVPARHRRPDPGSTASPSASRARSG